MSVIAIRQMSFIATVLSIATILPVGGPSIAATPSNSVTGTVTGIVVDEGGKPVARARLFIHAAFPPGLMKRPLGPPVITGPRIMTAMTDRTGAFVAGHLPNGQYVACAQPATQGLLNPCHWSAVASEFSVSGGKVATPLKITLAKGAILSIHVDDPHQLLSQSNRLIAGDLMFHILTPKGHPYPVFISVSDKTSRDHSITVPYGMPLSLRVLSPHLVVSDNAGKTLPAVASVDVPSVSTAAIYRYTVTGSK